MKRIFPIAVPAFLILALAVYYWQTNQSTKLYKKLPIVGNHRLETLQLAEGGVRIDTVFHKISPFKFTNQDGVEVDESIVKGKVYVCDYFFTTCKSICPIMSKQLDRVYEHWSDNPNVMILSHTVDPETDTPQVLKAYSEKFKANTDRWMFLTGTKEALYTHARRDYLLDARESFGGDEDFIHTQNFALVDQQGRIRGFYDGTSNIEVDQLIKDIAFLLMEK